MALNEKFYLDAFSQIKSERISYPRMSEYQLPPQNWEKIYEIQNQFKTIPLSQPVEDLPLKTTPEQKIGLSDTEKEKRLKAIDQRPISPIEKAILKLNEQEWMPSAWRSVLRDYVGSEGFLNKPYKLLYPWTVPWLMGKSIIGGVQAGLEVLDKVSKEYSKVIMPLVAKIEGRPLATLAALYEYLKDRPFTLQNLANAFKEAQKIGDETVKEIVNRLNKTDPHWDQMIFGPEWRKKDIDKFYDLVNQGKIKEAEQFVWKLYGKSFLATYLNVFGDPALATMTLTGMFSKAPIAKITPEDKAKALRALGFKEGYVPSPEEVRQKVAPLLDRLTKLASQHFAAGEKVKGVAVNSVIDNLMHHASVLTNSDTVIWLKGNWWQRIKSLLPEIFPKKPIIPASDITPRHLKDLKALEDTIYTTTGYKGTPEFWDLLAFRASKYRWGGMEMLDGKTIDKLISDANELINYTKNNFPKFKSSEAVPFLPWKIEEIKDIPKVAIEKLFNTRNALPEFYYLYTKADLKKRILDEAYIKFFKEVGIEKLKILPNSKLEKIFVSVASQEKNYIQSLSLFKEYLRRGEITADEYQRLAELWKYHRSFLDSFIPKIQQLNEWYGLNIKIRNNYYPRSILNQIVSKLNRKRELLRVGKFKLGEWTLDNLPVSDMSLPGHFRARKLPTPQALKGYYETMETYIYSINKFLNYKGPDEIARTLLPYLPENKANILLNYIRWMRGGPSVAMGALEKTISPAVRFSYWSTVGFNLKTALKNALQWIQEAVYSGARNVQRALETMYTPEGQDLIRQMGLFEQGIKRNLGFGISSSSIGKAIDEIEKASYFLWSEFDKSNRMISGLARYYKALEEGATHSQAIQEGIFGSIQTQYVYSKSNALLFDIMNPHFGPLILFKKWPLSQLQMFIEWFRTGNQMAFYRYLATVLFATDIMKKVGIDMTNTWTSLFRLVSGEPYIPYTEIYDNLKNIVQVIQSDINTPEGVNARKKWYKYILPAFNLEAMSIAEFIDTALNNWQIEDAYGKTIIDLKQGAKNKFEPFWRAFTKLVYSSDWINNYWRQFNEAKKSIAPIKEGIAKFYGAIRENKFDEAMEIAEKYNLTTNDITLQGLKTVVKKENLDAFQRWLSTQPKYLKKKIIENLMNK